MCGIVGGAFVEKPVAPFLTAGLKVLEYRGNDSVGVAFQKACGAVERIRAVGGAEALVLDANPCETVGLGHTRWATHGAVTVANAHPHTVGQITLVHNGILEYASSFRTTLDPWAPISETDTEIMAALLDLWRKTKTVEGTLKHALEVLGGSWSVVALDAENPGMLLMARKGSAALVVGKSADGYVVASDPLAFPSDVSERWFVDSWAHTTATAFVSESEPVWTTAAHREKTPFLTKGYGHFTRQEMDEQPEAMRRLGNAQQHVPDLQNGLLILGCGSSYYAGLFGKYWMEAERGWPVQVELASEFRSRRAVFAPETVVLGLSQSGETADTLQALERVSGQKRWAMVNRTHCTLARRCDGVFWIMAGPELGVAATKTFTNTLMAFMCIAGEKRANPQAVVETLKLDTVARSWSERLISASVNALSAPGPLFSIGKGLLWPIALETALKWKELVAIPMDGVASGELKHGTLALIDGFAHVLLFASGHACDAERTVSTVKEIRAREGAVWLVTDVKGAACFASLANDTMVLEAHDEASFVVAAAVFGQLLAYHGACLRGLNPDRPRNLAKSVTVE